MEAPPQDSRFNGRYAPSDAELVQLCAEGNEWAAAAIHSRYQKRVRSLAHQNWPPVMRSRFDADDIVQEVFERFFRALRRGFYSTTRETGLWGFLLVVTLNQVRNAASHHLCRRRDVRQTVGQGSRGQPREREFASQMPVAHSTLVVEELMTAMSPDMRQVVERRLEGYTVPEIADAMLISHRAVERLLQAVRQRLAASFERSPDPAPEPLLRLRRVSEKSGSKEINGEADDGTRLVRTA